MTVVINRVKHLVFVFVAVLFASCNQNQDISQNAGSSENPVVSSNNEGGKVVKISVVYFSKSGNTRKMAEVIVEGAQSVPGVDVKAFSVDKVDDSFLNESQCIIMGTPTYMSGMSADFLRWMEGVAIRYDFTGKLGGAFSTARYIDGGGDIAIQNITSRMLVLGFLVYSGGVRTEKPGIHLGPVSLDSKSEDSRVMFRVYGQRMAEKTKEIFK